MIYLAADHAGFELKNQIKDYLKGELKLEVEDMGAHEENPDDDYPDFIIPAVQKVAESPEHNKGIVVGGSGQGEAIAANKVKGVRALLYYGGSLDIVKLSRAHNDANVLSIGARFVDFEQAKKAIDVWLATEFEGGRHERRIEKIKQLESGL